LNQWHQAAPIPRNYKCKRKGPEPAPYLKKRVVAPDYFTFTFTLLERAALKFAASDNASGENLGGQLESIAALIVGGC
jgi:hypothetical protein